MDKPVRIVNYKYISLLKTRTTRMYNYWLEMEKKSILDTAFLLLMGIWFSTADENLNWEIEKKILHYGEGLYLFCQVENCCQQSAGWGKWTSNNELATIFIDVKILQTDECSKYYGGTNNTGFFLLIRNITSDDLNIAYSCTYGFQVGKKKILLETDAFIAKTEIDPDDSIKDSTTEKENPILSDSEISSSIAETVFIAAVFIAAVFIAAVAVVVILIKIKASSTLTERPNNGDQEDVMLPSEYSKSQASKDDVDCRKRWKENCCQTN